MFLYPPGVTNMHSMTTIPYNVIPVGINNLHSSFRFPSIRGGGGWDEYNLIKQISLKYQL